MYCSVSWNSELLVSISRGFETTLLFAVLGIVLQFDGWMVITIASRIISKHFYIVEKIKDIEHWYTFLSYIPQIIATKLFSDKFPSLY